MRAALLAFLLAWAGAAAAQQELPANGLLLVAKPAVEDPSFGRSVVLVTQAPDGHTVGVILNRPTRARHKGRPLWFGGPVMPSTVIAVFHAAAPPKASAFHVLKNLYLTMHPENVDALLAEPKARYRLYAGFSGWAPRQLEVEFEREGWYAMPADEAIVFREDTSRLWEELIERLEEPRA